MSILRIYNQSDLNESLRKKLQARESAEDTQALSSVQSILEDVRTRGIEAVKHYSEKFDGFYPEPALCTAEEIEAGEKRLPAEIKEAFSKL